MVLSKYQSLDRYYLVTDFSKGHISEILRGKGSPSVNTLIKLADALAVDVCGFFIFREKSERDRAVELLRDAPAETLHRLIRDLTDATSGLTYTLSTVGATVNQDVMIRSHITGSITGPLWATSSGAIKWAGGSAPTSSGTSGYTDILRLYFDGTNWQEVSRSIGNH
jgi:transcriptional regulator with XRE-family HTH domain